MVNDVTILSTLMTVLILISVIMPFVNDEFGTTTSTLDVENLAKKTGDAVNEESSVLTWIDTIVQIGKGFFIRIEGVPAWLELIFFWPIRLMIILLLYRQARSGGG